MTGFVVDVKLDDTLVVHLLFVWSGFIIIIIIILVWEKGIC